jgi:hypothetical protein
MKLLVMAAVVLVLVFGGGGLAYQFVKDHADKAIHEAVDTSLPEVVKANPWAPVLHGRPAPRDALRFDSGSVSTVRCHVSLGRYTVSILHGFSFHKGTARIPHGCPGALVRTKLGHAIRVSRSQDGSTTVLTFTDKGHGTVLTLRATHG